MRGLFLSIEGIEGVGKSTLFSAIADFIRDQSIPLVETREPGGTAVAEAIRSILLENHQEQLIPETELFLMFASRAQHVKHVIQPALDQGACVLCDRFVDASYAYQGGGRGIEKSLIEAMSNATIATMPDRTILLDAPVEVALSRMKERGKLDRIESEDIAFFTAIRNTYLDIAAQTSERFIVIDATMSQEEVISKAKIALTPLLVSLYD